MKLLNKLGLFCAAALAMSSCVDKDPDYQIFPNPDVDFTYNVDGDQYILDYYVVSTIQFNNTSAKSGAVSWDFGDGQTSTESSPKHKYAAAGLYKVTLTIDGVGYCTYPLLIQDIVPQLSINSQSSEIVEFGSTLVDFALALPNPENKIVRYVWTFPEGTTTEDGQPLPSFEGYSHADGSVDYPGKVKFSNIGSQKIDLAAYFDTEGENRRLEDTYLNVQVGCNQPAATLYYAVRGGNIKALKLIDTATLPAGTKVLPYDMGVKSGSMPFQLVYASVPSVDDDGAEIEEGWVYILDAGKQYYYINDESGTLGDGLITAMRVDGSGVNTVLTNVGQYAFADPFQGFAFNGSLYYTDRNTGVSKVALTTRGAVQPMNATRSSRGEYWVQNNLIPYYQRGISYGAISTGILRDSKGVWWWGKCYNGYGIFRFRETDIYPSQALADAAERPFGIICDGQKIKAFNFDEDRQNLYVWNTAEGAGGFYVFDLPGDQDAPKFADAKKSILMDADPINTTESEKVYTTQFAVDNETGYCYFGFRPSSTEETYKAGVYYYNPDTEKIVKYGETNDPILGMTLNPNKTKLF